jgi:histidyl-tRNA synthetase
MSALAEEFPNPLVAEGVEAMVALWTLAESEGLGAPELVFAPGLARGLNYYTGAIFEVQVVDSPVGSICGGGRYDDLTGIFGMPGVSGVGISFGADRIYDVLEHFDAFPDNLATDLDVLVLHMGEDTLGQVLQAAKQLRTGGHRTELYPDPAKLKKQFKYADDRGVPHVLIIGSDEAERGEATLRNMKTGGQSTGTVAELMEQLAAG